MSGQRNLTRPRPHADDWVKRTDLPLLHRIVRYAGLLPPAAEDVAKPGPSDKLPVFTPWNQMLYLAPFAFGPFVARYLYYHYVSNDMPGAWAMWGLLSFYTMQVGLMFIWGLGKLATKYGYLDNQVGRDTVPYEQVSKVMTEAISGLLFRPAFVVLCTYDKHAPPQLSMWLPIQLFAFTLVEDFIYYWFHRATHESESAWKLHRFHHTTKHPTPILLGYADEIQEVFDVFGAPFLSWLIYPLDFDALSVWMIIHISIQLHGHSGIRLHYGTILTGPFLTMLGMELVCEDHDLHHRHGWKDSYNYGKQSRVWDTLFGTMGERVEGHAANLDWDQFITL